MRNAVRRNRNIGQAWAGHGDTNDFRVPERWDSRESFWLTLRDPIRVVESGLTFWVEPPHPGHLHYVSVDDVVRVIRQLPPDDVDEIQTIVLRQPTRKQRTFAAVWGRLTYFANLADGLPVIVLEAQSETPLRWSRRVDPDDADELERLVADGHRLEEARRHRILHRTAASNRATQLYRSLVHEVGHYVHYIDEVLTGDDAGFDARRDRYFAKPQREREAFAHRYADRIGSGIERFAPMLDEVNAVRRGLPLEWFASPSAHHASHVTAG